MASHRRGITLAGIIYTHSITTGCVDGALHHNLRSFAGLCGDKYVKKVVYLTTRWDEVMNTEDAEVAKQREADLETSYWNDLILHGATIGRFDINDPKSPWVIVDKMIHRHESGKAYRTRRVKAGQLRSSDIVIV